MPIIDTSQDDTYNNRIITPKKFASSLKINTFHWKRDKVDTRDFLYRTTQKLIKTKVDLRGFCSPIENQGSLGSCTGQAVAGAIELLNKRNKKPTDVSRLYIYWYERFLINTINYDSGAYIRDGIKATNKYGAPLERLWPYIINRFTIKPSKEANDDAIKRKVTLYERISNFDGCIDALNNGYPIIIGFMVYNSFMTTNVSKFGMMPYPNTSKEKLLGGHAVLLVGYDLSNNLFIARNSWGGNWGDNGYFYMPFDVIKNPLMSGDFWIIKNVLNP